MHSTYTDLGHQTMKRTAWPLQYHFKVLYSVKIPNVSQILLLIAVIIGYSMVLHCAA